MIKVGQYNTLKVIRLVDFGVYLEDEAEGILLPKRFVPDGTQKGDIMNAFVYHDGEGRLIATIQKPIGVVGDIVKLKARTVTPHGAFLDNGLMKDVFVPRVKQVTEMLPNQDYLVKIEIDKVSGRMVANEKLDSFLSNETLTVKELEVVDLIVYRKTNIGYVVIINNTHTGVLHSNDVFRNINIGDSLVGFIKKIYPEDTSSKIRFKIDVAIGKPGYNRVEDETEKILRLLTENKGYLPYHDKSNPDDIYTIFGMSKKTFKMTVGTLFKQRKIVLEKNGIRLSDT
jgi:predicted RNA-binding protein (virulence factor B family)